MEGKKVWDFECPQYYNFTSGLDSSGRDDIYFDCEDPVTNDEVFNNLHTPGNTANIKGLTEDAENKLVDKMTAALSIIGNTPKLATMKKKKFSEHISSKNTCCRTARKDTMRKTLHVPAVKIHRSKSVVALNRMPEKQNKEKGLRKRSSSLNDLRTNKNKKTFPMTPMCLKRTIIKSKAKVAAKTTEEMQLEEIARLQKQLIQHLRYNEISLKKLNLKPRTYQNPKNIQIKAENLKEMKVCEKGMNPFLEKLNLGQKEIHQNIHKLNHETVKNQAQKLNSIISRGKSKGTDKVAKSSAWTKTPSVASTSSAVSETSEKDKAPVSKKPQTVRKFGLHSGLTFHDNIKKVTVVKPFSFDLKIKETKNTGSEQNVDVSLSNSVMDLKVKDDKENIPHCRVRPMSNFKLDQNPKPDISKYFGSGKKIQSRMTNQIRGLPLSENIIRN